jgi:DNA mismatch repair protein MutH
MESNEGRHLSKEEILKIGESVVGRTFGELGYADWHKEHAGGKGSLGEFVEERVYGYPINNLAEADFADAGIELKVAGLRYDKERRKWISKERLVLSVIDYMTICDTPYEESAFLKKNKNLFVIFYLYKDGEPLENFPIVAAKMLKLDPGEEYIIQYDWQTIADKVRDGEADKLSEGDTCYLAACEKGASKETTRPQPYSKIPAKQRAFSLKPTFMTRLVNKVLPRGLSPESIIKNVGDFAGSSLFDAIEKKLRPFYGYTEDTLKQSCGIDSNPKNLDSLIIWHLLGLDDDERDDELSAAGIQPKTVVLESSGVLKESMSFPAFDYCKLVKTAWDDSEIKEILSDTRFFFVVWQKRPDGSKILKRCKFWKMPEEDIEKHVRPVYEKMVALLKAGTIMNPNHPKSNLFPKMADDYVCHVRPHGANKADVYPLPVQDKTTGIKAYTKSCFWLGHLYIRKILESN